MFAYFSSDAPLGVSLSPDGELTVLPTVPAGTYLFTASALDISTFAQASRTVTLQVVPSNAQPYFGVSKPLAQTINFATEARQVTLNTVSANISFVTQAIRIFRTRVDVELRLGSQADVFVPPSSALVQFKTRADGPTDWGGS